VIDILERLDEELDRTPANQHVCKPLRRGVVAAAAAEIRRLRVQVALLQHAAPEAAPEPVNDSQ
jgi:hypothetical protein